MSSFKSLRLGPRHCHSIRLNWPLALLPMRDPIHQFKSSQRWVSKPSSFSISSSPLRSHLWLSWSRRSLALDDRRKVFDKTLQTNGSFWHNILSICDLFACYLFFLYLSFSMHLSAFFVAQMLLENSLSSRVTNLPRCPEALLYSPLMSFAKLWRFQHENSERWQ